MTISMRARAVTAVSAAVGAALMLTVAVVPTATSTAAGRERCSRAVGPTFYAPGSGKTVALSFDDGPTKFTPQVLRILRAHDVRATFFVTGRHAAARPRLLRQVVAEGHLLAGHTFDHDYPDQVSGGWTRSYVAEQMRRTNRVLSAVTHQPICFFRPPGGHQTSGMYDAARAHGVEVVLWSVSSGDWAQPASTTAAATQNIIDRATAGGSQTHPSVLMHDGKGSHEPESEVSSNRSNTVAALPAIIRYYRSNGYRFVDHSGRSGLPPQRTTLRIATAPATIPAGTRTVLKGTVAATTGPVVRQEVAWSTRRPGARRWRRGGAVSTDAAGGFRLGVKPRSDTAYRFVLPATPRYRRAVGQVAVSTHRVATHLTVAGPTSIAAGDSVSLEVAVTSDAHPRAGESVVVRRRVDGVVVTSRVRTDAKGRATFTDQPTASTRYTLTVPRRLPYEAGSGRHEVAVEPVDPTEPTEPGEPTEP